MQDTDPSCPRCGPAEPGGARCPACAGLWVPEQTLHGFLRAYLIEQGQAPAGFSLLEMPGSGSRWSCRSCQVPLDQVRFRGVAVDRCTSCRRVFLEAGVAQTIAQRVLLAARAHHSSGLARKSSGSSRISWNTRAPAATNDAGSAEPA
ncbi:MAG TPA: zf-TFIIB domain-containing protein [Candidatus Polarisedimenticolaceae bacterium]|nr:zf-TFIIB domain-containing protein [Candidatus Polarisedimenticolaceae bacterium]